MAQKKLAQLTQERQASVSAASPAAPGVPKNNPEIDAKIDKFAAENPKLVAYYTGLDHERLVRSCLLTRANEQERSERRQAHIYQDLKKWVAQSPELQASIDKKLTVISDEQKTGAFINMARRAQEYAGRQAPPIAPRADHRPAITP